MRFFIALVSTVFLGMVVSGCDPTYQVDYQVMNATGESIKIIVDHNGNLTDTNVISSGTTLIFFNDFGIGRSTSDYLDGLASLPVGLSIIDKAGHIYNKDVQEISNWRKFYPPKKSDGLGSVELTVHPSDFE
jgi:hypothetical protein